MTLPLRILRTKKRLSSDRWYLVVIVIAILGLTYVLNFGMRAVSLSPKYGIVRAEIPVMSASPDDPAFHQFLESPRNSISENTTAIVLNTKGDFVFGDVSAFSNGYSQVRNKFIVNQIDGEPQTAKLIETIRQWQFHRESTRGIKSDKIAVLLPASTIPVTVVIQIVGELKASKYFDDVVLANGLL